MVFLRGAPWEPAQLPKGVLPDEELFVVKSSGEVFREYEDYLGAARDQHIAIWGCQLTGTAGLTYQQAATSEATSRELLRMVRTIGNQALLIATAPACRPDDASWCSFPRSSSNRRSRSYTIPHSRFRSLLMTFTMPTGCRWCPGSAQTLSQTEGLASIRCPSRPSQSGSFRHASQRCSARPAYAPQPVRRPFPTDSPFCLVGTRRTPLSRPELSRLAASHCASRHCPIGAELAGHAHPLRLGPLG